MRERGQKFILGLTGSLCLAPRRALILEQTSMVNCQRDAIGDELQQPCVVFGELMRRQGADVKHSNDAAFDKQRYAEQRADSFLAQQRTEYFGTVNIIDAHRGLFGGDPACKTGSERNANSAFNLLLEASGGPDQQFVAFGE